MKVIIQTIKTTLCQVPFLIPITLVLSIFSTVKPFIAFQFMGLIVNQLFDGKNLQEIFISAAILVLITFLLDIVMTLLTNQKDVYIIELTYKQDLTLAKNAMNMEYCRLESNEVQILLENIKQSKFQRGDCFAKQIDLINKFCTSFFTIIAALLQILKIVFTAMNNTEVHVLYIPLIILFLITILGWVSILSAKNGIKHGKTVFMRFSEVAPINRIFGFYRQELFPNYRYGKDIRIYEEQELINHEFNNSKNAVRKFMEKIGNEEARFRVKNTVLTSFLLFVTYIFVGFLAYYRMIDIGTVVIFVGIITKFLEGINGNILTITELSENKKFLQQYFDFIDHNSAFYEDKNIISNKQNEDDNKESIRALIGDIHNGNFEIEFNEYINFISVVFQDFELFSIKLFQNIAASDQADIHKIEKVLKDVNMQNRVNAMQNGIHTYLNYDFDGSGVELSGGEAQKIAISKVLYKDSPCCIMDEPTSALDPMAEAEIYNQFNTLLSEKTLVFISHRLSSCIFCDRILVFHNGELKGMGVHDDLLKESELYNKMWEAQAKNYIL